MGLRSSVRKLQTAVVGLAHPLAELLLAIKSTPELELNNRKQECFHLLILNKMKQYGNSCNSRPYHSQHCTTVLRPAPGKTLLWLPLQAKIQVVLCSSQLSYQVKDDLSIELFPAFPHPHARSPSRSRATNISCAATTPER